MSWNAIGPKLNGDGLASLHHLAEMSKQSKASYVGTGMDVGSMLLQRSHQVMLAFVHHAQGRLHILGLGDSRHGGGEEHTNSKWTAQQERITRLNPPFGPWH